MLRKKSFILWVMALLGASDIIQNGSQSQNKGEKHAFVFTNGLTTCYL